MKSKGLTQSLRFRAERMHLSGEGYDANGNLTTSAAGGVLSVSYNVLNLPQTVTLQDGTTVHYMYSASGVKLRESISPAPSVLPGSPAGYPISSNVIPSSSNIIPGSPNVITNGSNFIPSSLNVIPSGSNVIPSGSNVIPSEVEESQTTDYVGNLIYRNGVLQKILTGSGYIEPSDSTESLLSAPAYRYFVKDHLGSVRVVADAQGRVLQRNEYHPYGEDCTVEYASGGSIFAGMDIDGDIQGGA